MSHPPVEWTYDLFSHQCALLILHYPHLFEWKSTTTATHWANLLSSISIGGRVSQQQQLQQPHGFMVTPAVFIPLVLAHEEQDEFADMTEIIEEEDQDRTASTTSHESNENTVEYFPLEYHIFLHPTYQVPTLGLYAQRKDGEPLSSATLRASLSSKLHPSLNETDDAWIGGYLSMIEHPFLKHQFLHMIHPCQTKEWMKICREDLEHAIQHQTSSAQILEEEKEEIGDLDAELESLSTQPVTSSCTTSNTTTTISNSPRVQTPIRELSSPAVVKPDISLDGSTFPLLFWLSSIGPFVGLYIDITKMKAPVDSDKRQAE